MSPTPSARRPWLQFSLKSVLVLTLIVAAFFAGLTFFNLKLEQAMQAEKAARLRAEALEKKARMAEQMAVANEKEALRQRTMAMANFNKAAARLKQAQDEKANSQWGLMHEQYRRRLAEEALKRIKKERTTGRARKATNAAKEG